MSLTSSPISNRLLAALPDAVLARLQPLIEHVELPQGRVLHESGVALGDVYFPTTAIVSLIQLTAGGNTVGIAVVGSEGMVGVTLFLGGEPALHRAVVQRAGHALRLRAEALKAELDGSAAAMFLMLRYTQALITQLAQTAVCNRLHPLDRRLCRWLLMSLDRLHGGELTLTQDLIAGLLGVRREGVTAAAARLQRDGLIRYSRGRLTVVDRAALEQRACECYAVVRQEYRRLLPEPDAQ